MFDNTPDLKWSNAWWGRLIFGVVAPPLLLACFIFSIATEQALTISYTRFDLNFIPVDGLQARLMAFAYLGFSISLFGYAYARHSFLLSHFHQYILFIGLLISLFSLSWCTLLLYTG